MSKMTTKGETMPRTGPRPKRASDGVSFPMTPIPTADEQLVKHLEIAINAFDVAARIEKYIPGLSARTHALFALANSQLITFLESVKTDLEIR